MHSDLEASAYGPATTPPCWEGFSDALALWDPLVLNQQFLLTSSPSWGMSTVRRVLLLSETSQNKAGWHHPYHAMSVHWWLVWVTHLWLKYLEYFSLEVALISEVLLSSVDSHGWQVQKGRCLVQLPNLLPGHRPAASGQHARFITGWGPMRICMLQASIPMPADTKH